MKIPKKWGRPLAVLLAAAGVGMLFFLYRSDPENQTVFPCVLRLVTSFDCPGCGMTRAFHALLHLDFPRALRFNAFSFLLFPTLLVVWAQLLFYLWRGRFFRLPFRVPVQAVWAAAVLLIIFTVVRNLPFYPFTLLKV